MRAGVKPDNRETLFDKSVHSNIFVFIVLCFLGIIIYSNTFAASFHFDDQISITQNPAIRHLSPLGIIWNFWPTRFVTYLTVAINYYFGQYRVFGYHLFNLAVHLVSGLLVWRFVLLTFSTPALKDKPIAAHARLLSLFAGLIFVSHPLQTQGVTYIIQRTTSLAALFYLASLCLYIQARLLGDKEKRASRLYYAGSLAAALLAMFTKEMTITLPLMILLYEFCFLKTQKSMKGKAPLPFLVTLLIIPLTIFLTKSFDFVQMRRMDEGPIGISSGEYLLTQFRVLMTYLRLTFFPIHQNLDYDYPIAKSLIEPTVLISFLILVIILILAQRLFSKHKLVSFGIFWFFLTLLPESSIIPIRDVIFEHRLYLPMVGFALFLVSGLYDLFKGKNLKTMTTILLILIAGYSILTYRRNTVWKDDFTLWEDIIRKSPQKVRSYNDRGNAYAVRGNFKEAIDDYNKAIEISFKQASAKGLRTTSDIYKVTAAKLTLAIAYNNRGLTYVDMGAFAEAISDFNKAIEINPRLISVYDNRGAAYKKRGLLYVQKGDLERALSDFNKALELNPDDANAHNNRGNIYSDRGDIQEAIADYTRALELNPDLAPAYINRAKQYFKNKEYDKCRKDVYRAQALGY